MTVVSGAHEQIVAVESVAPAAEVEDACPAMRAAADQAPDSDVTLSTHDGLRRWYSVAGAHLPLEACRHAGGSVVRPSGSCYSCAMSERPFAR